MTMTNQGPAVLQRVMRLPAFRPMGTISRRSTQPRDTQKAKLYRAEQVLDRAPEFRSVSQVEAYVERVTRSRWFVRHYGSISVEVRDGRGRRIACGISYGGWDGEIRMPIWSRSKSVILHELAHVVAHCRRKQARRPVDAAHGREFAAVYLALVQHYLGIEDAKKLKAAFRAHHVRFRPKRKGGVGTAPNMEGLKRWQAAKAAAAAAATEAA